MNEIVNLIIKILVSLIAIYLVPAIKNFITAKLGEKKTEQLFEIIDAFVESAQQTLAGEEGQVRKEYVTSNLKKLGIEITEQVNAYIESSVYRLHNK